MVREPEMGGTPQRLKPDFLRAFPKTDFLGPARGQQDAGDASKGAMSPVN